MTTKASRWGLMGGTFNPVHSGHLIIARWAGETLGLDRVGLMPNARSPLREGEKLVPGPLRLEMVRAAVEGEDGLEALDAEVSRGGTSYLVETLEELIRRHPERQWVFLMGADSLTTFDRWVRVEDIVRLAEVKVMPRPGHEAGEELEALFERKPALRDHIGLMREGPRIDISATDIRERVCGGRSIRYLVPGAVRELIRRHGLYAG